MGKSNPHQTNMDKKSSVLAVRVGLTVRSIFERARIMQLNSIQKLEDIELFI